MIDEKINNSLRELEQGLKSMESARKQVEKTVNSYDGLNSTTADYVSKLGTITTKVQELVDAIGKDYSQKVKAFEKDRETVINASTAATKKLSNATEEFKDSLVEIQTKLKYSLIVNAVSLAAIAAILFYLLK
jgi:chromosome segregation ATPase